VIRGSFFLNRGEKITFSSNNTLSLTTFFTPLTSFEVVEKIQVKGEKVTLIARKNILLRAISLQNKGNFEKVLTTGVRWLPLLNTFRTVDWKKMREEIEPFRVMLEQKLLPVNT